MNYIKHLTAIFEIMDSDSRLTPFHVSLYMSLFRCWNRNFFHNPVSISRDEIMKMAKIGSANTYVRCLKELHLWNYIRYEPSYNRHKGSLVYLYTFDNSTDNASVMPVRPSINNINIVNKENLIEQAQNFESKNLDMKSNEEEKEKFRQKKKNEETNPSGSIPPPLEHVKIYFDEKNFPAVEAEKFFNYFESNGWLVGGRAKMKDWKAAARNWILNIPKFAPKPKPPQSNSSQPNTPKNYGEPL
ncbi:MAG: transcriptional regulator [Ignavibacteria bacterium]|nr:transcriptional regulator [Ignavibacteria bacterium]